MKFQDLSESDKQRARDEYTSEGYLDYDWWDGVYEDAVNVAEILGIEIATRGEHNEIDIRFSGFCCQGDGACFAGEYRWAKNACTEIVKYAPLDSELLRIAQQLTLLQITRRLLGLEPFSATITMNGRYSHSGTMDAELHFEEDEEDPVDAIEATVTQLMRDFADWIYAQLETENNWLYSAECVDDALEDKEFDEDGVEV